MITRRNFLAGSILAIPGAAAIGGLLRSLPIKEAEYMLVVQGWAPLILTAFTNGTVTARYDGVDLVMSQDGNWLRFLGSGVECKVRRSLPNSIDVDWISLWAMRESPHNDFSFAPGEGVVDFASCATPLAFCDFMRIRQID